MPRCYSKKIFVNGQNSKTEGTNIINIDTIRGCSNNCESCYAKRNSFMAIQHFEIPVKIKEYTGKIRAENVYRIGTSGDPATDWGHSEELAKKSNLINCFVVTKLQSIVGYTGYFKNMQVSVDPMNYEHMKTTLINVQTLIQKYYDLNIVLRIRSCKTTDKVLKGIQRQAVEFANTYKLKVLETRVRFLRKAEALEKYSLDPAGYQKKYSGYYRPRKNVRFLKGVKKHFVCDESGKKCKGCLNCKKLFKL